MLAPSNQVDAQRAGGGRKGKNDKKQKKQKKDGEKEKLI